MEGPLSRIFDFVLVSMRPLPDANTSAIRKAGALAVGLGLLLLGASIPAVAALDEYTGSFAIWIASPLWVGGFAGVVIGGFRLVFAAEPSQVSPAKQVGFGVLFGCASLALAITLVLLVSVYLGK